MNSCNCRWNSSGDSGPLKIGFCISVKTSVDLTKFRNDLVSTCNAALSLLNLCCYFLDRQLAAQATAFEKEGAFTERLYHVRNARRT
ncbi:MAG: hypothetical protein DME18_08530 [Verrucomicrobia bacterium]|nr:MAG: hypothetical protein DME18_08530 [Verrucomicrobiota bacterium]